VKFDIVISIVWSFYGFDGFINRGLLNNASALAGSIRYLDIYAHYELP